MFHDIRFYTIDLLSSIGLSGELLNFITGILLFALVTLLVIATYYVVRVILGAIVRVTMGKKGTQWRKYLHQQKVFLYLSLIVTLLITRSLVNDVFVENSTGSALLNTAYQLAITLSFTLIITSFLGALVIILSEKEATKDKPIKSYSQVVSIIVWGISIIIVVSILLGKSPTVFLAGLGAFSAVLMLVFQDPILGFVNSLQISSNDLLRNGDWITMNQFGVDGTVFEINLTSVKVLNFDNTVSTIPVRQLVSGSFQNWRQMGESGARRMKRSVSIDVSSIQFCTQEMIENFKKNDLLKSYIDSRDIELKERGISPLPKTESMTNLELFRAYLRIYLKNNSDISQKNIILVRELCPNEHGLPIEIYCFTSTTAWIEYEEIQARVLDHFYAALPYFGLIAHQRDRVNMAPLN